jgi:hypothetical protein
MSSTPSSARRDWCSRQLRPGLVGGDRHPPRSVGEPKNAAFLLQVPHKTAGQARVARQESSLPPLRVGVAAAEKQSVDQAHALSKPQLIEGAYHDRIQ